MTAIYMVSLPGSLGSGNYDRVSWHSKRPALGSIVVGDFTYISWIQTLQAGVMLPEMSIPSFNMYYAASTSQALSWEARV